MSRVRRILHPSDFSRASAVAFAKAVELAQDNGAELLVVHVFTPPLPMVGGRTLPPTVYIRFAESAREWARQQLDQLVARARKAGVRTRGLLLEGIAHERIMRAARANRTDLIVLGTHGRTGLMRLVPGSLAGRVASTATCPVITVRGK